MDEELKRLSEEMQFPKHFLTQVKLALIVENSEQQDTAYDLVNALTNAAQSLSADDQYDVEVIAGRLLESLSNHSSFALP